MTSLRALLFFSTTCLAATSARADVLTLTQGTNLDITALALDSCGDMAFQANLNRLWVTDGATNGQAFAISPTTGALINTIDPSPIPGLDGGPDALAVGSPTFGSTGRFSSGRLFATAFLTN